MTDEAHVANCASMLYIVCTFFFSCSASKGWLNPPLHFSDEPCRHKILDLIGDLSLFAQSGNQGLPVAHIVAYKARAFGSVFPILKILICQFHFQAVTIADAVFCAI